MWKPLVSTKRLRQQETVNLSYNVTPGLSSLWRVFAVMANQFVVCYRLTAWFHTTNVSRLVFYLAMLMTGIGSNPLYSLGVTYLDENVKQRFSSLYNGMRLLYVWNDIICVKGNLCPFYAECPIPLDAHKITKKSQVFNLITSHNALLRNVSYLAFKVVQQFFATFDT